MILRRLPLRTLCYCVLLTLGASVVLFLIPPIVPSRSGRLPNSLLRKPAHAQPQRPKGIPKTIWYKLGPNGLNDDARNWTDSCINSNPDYHVRFMTEEDADAYVKKAFASRPHMLESYLGLRVPILKADLLRYLLLFDQGGVWFDLDVSCEGIPMDDWVPPEYKDTAGLVVGWEFDMGWEKPFVHQFTSWTIMAKAGSPHMLQVIDDLLAALREKMDEHKVSVGNVTLAMVGDVVDFSGPRRLTFGVLKSISKALNRTVAAEEISELYEPRLVGDVLVMPGRSFAASANKYTAEEEGKLPPKLVTHHYAGSWKNDYGGEAAQGRVEPSSAR